jgi:hypothetical protein
MIDTLYDKCVIYSLSVLLGILSVSPNMAYAENTKLQTTEIAQNSFTISGNIVDIKGNPLKDVHVFVPIPSNTEWKTGKGDVIMQAKRDEKGTFALVWAGVVYHGIGGGSTDEKGFFEFQVDKSHFKKDRIILPIFATYCEPVGCAQKDSDKIYKMRKKNEDLIFDLTGHTEMLELSGRETLALGKIIFSVDK